MIIKHFLFFLGLMALYTSQCFSTISTPIIRVDAGYHSGPIFGLESLIANDRLVTTSHDKTIKIWRSKDFKLLQTLRIPIGNGFEGNMDSIAVSPDGKLIAVGGWTCWENDKQGCVYLFDITTGHLIHCIDHLKNLIGELRFSPDGRVLAIGLHGDGGVVFLDSQSYQILGQDQDYGERVTGLSFSVTGFSVSGSNDGYLRVYDPQFKVAARIKVPDISRIADTYFSPDGKRLLVSSYDSPLIQILSLPQLQVEYSLKLDPSQSLKTLRNAVWSQSGEFIYSSGDAVNAQEAEILRWRVADPSDYESIKIPHRVQSIRPRSQNGIVFSTEDASIGILADNENVPQISYSHTIQHLQMSDRFRVSVDGSNVMFPIARPFNESLVFAVNQLSLGNDSTNFNFEASRKISRKLNLTEWENAYAPKLNGQPLELEPFEIVRSYAYATDDNRVFLGTEWAIKAFDKSGSLIWNKPMSGTVWNLTVSGNGLLVVAALSDGTIRWYRTVDGQEVLALFVEPRSREWVLWRPDGYYASSENGDNLIGWHVNRGKNKDPDFYRAVQFERQFYRPDLLRTQIGSHEAGSPSKLASGKPLNQDSVMTRRATASSNIASTAAEPVLSAVNLSQLNDIAPPRIRIASMQTVKNDQGFNELELTVDAEKNSRPMRDVTVYANLLPMTANQERSLDPSEADKFRRTFRFPINGGDNLIRVEVNNGVSLGLAEQWLEAPALQQTTPPKGDLYVLAVGVDHFERISADNKKKIPDLNYAVNDAVKLAEVLQNQASQSEFNQIHVTVLADSIDLKPTRQNILQALRLFEQAGPNDTILLFLASHGFSDDTGNYYFLPQDGDFGDVESVLSGRNLTGKAPSLLSWTDFLDNMRKASGRRVMIVDTCQAKNIFGEFDSRSLRKRSAAALFPLLLASKGDELSQEYESARHGLFTHALLEGLRGLADANHDRKITVTELHDFAVPLVEKLHNPKGGPQTPQLIAPGVLGGIVLPIAESKSE